MTETTGIDVYNVKEIHMKESMRFATDDTRRVFGYSPEWKVVPWVRDVELEKVLNDLSPDWNIVEMFRNIPGADGQETTTIVGKR
jgi:hypothetical protein